MSQAQGQGLTEYLIVVVIVAVLVLGALRLFGGSVGNKFDSATRSIEQLETSSPERTIKFSDESRGSGLEDSSSGETLREGYSQAQAKSSDGLGKDIAELSTDGVGSVKEDVAKQIQLDWFSVILFALIICSLGFAVVVRMYKGKIRFFPAKRSSPKAEQAEEGQAMVEFLFVAITFLFVILGVIQLALALNAYSLVRYAAYNAARAGIVHGGDSEQMHEAARISLLAMFPVHGRADHRRGMVDNYLASLDTDSDAALSYYGEPITEVKILDTHGLGSGAVVTFDDPFEGPNATITVQVRHLYELVIPLVNRIVFYAYTSWREIGSQGDESLMALSRITNERRREGDFKDIEYRIPLVAHYTMRLQSDYVVE